MRGQVTCPRSHSHMACTEYGFEAKLCGHRVHALNLVLSTTRAAAAAAKLLQSCLTLCDPRDRHVYLFAWHIVGTQ